MYTYIYIYLSIYLYIYISFYISTLSTVECPPRPATADHQSRNQKPQGPGGTQQDDALFMAI